MLGILVHLKKQAVKRLRPEDNEEADKENSPDNQNVSDVKQSKDGSIRLADDTLEMSMSDPYVVGALVDVVCIFWMSRCQELSNKANAEYRALLEKKSSKILTLLFKAYKSHEVHRSVIYLSSFLPHASAQTIVSYCLSRLRSAEIDPSVLGSKFPSWNQNFHAKLKEELTVTSYVDALCNWRRGDDILEQSNKWISEGMYLLFSISNVKFMNFEYSNFYL